MPGARPAYYAGGRYEEDAVQDGGAEGARHARGKSRRQAHGADGDRVPWEEGRQGVREDDEGQQGRDRELQAGAYGVVGLQPGESVGAFRSCYGRAAESESRRVEPDGADS